MPFALAIIGIVFMVTAVRNTTGTLFSLVKDDFTGSGNYLYWVISIMVIGSVGYVKKLQPVSDMFLALVLLVLFIANKGFFAKFMSDIKSGSATTCTDTSAATAEVSPGLGSLPSPNMNAPLSAPSSNIPGLSNFGEGVLQMQSIGM